MFSNSDACISLHKKSALNVVEDYIISFNETQCDIECILHCTLDIVRQLIKHFSDYKFLKGRLVVKAVYKHEQHHDERAYHFSSYQAELIDDPDEFYVRHIEKVASRMENFHVNGSNLTLQRIEHVHICLYKVKGAMQS